MLSDADLAGVVKRILTDLYWFRTESVALRKLAGKDHVGLDFFKVAHIALVADRLHRLGRILDRYSLGTIRASDGAGVDAALVKRGLSIAEVESFTKRFKPIRNKILAHSDPSVALNPDALYKQANIKGREIEKIAKGLWGALRDYHQTRFGAPAPSGPAYSGDDIARIHTAYMRRQRGRGR